MAGKSDRDRSGILQGGPQWITAIAVLITALVGAAGFFTGRATAPAGSAKPAPTITITVTVTASPATPSTSSAPSAAVYYHGSVGIGPKRPRLR
jgi:hypothetical protein